MARLILMPQAERDLEYIGDTIALDNPARSVSFVAELIDACSLRATMPRSSQKRTDLNGFPRSFPFRDYLVFYDILEDGDGIQVIAIMHGRRDLSKAFPKR